MVRLIKYLLCCSESIRFFKQQYFYSILHVLSDHVVGTYDTYIAVTGTHSSGQVHLRRGRHVLQAEPQGRQVAWQDNCPDS
jgi:hypothetical protein